ncbi:substrate-binding periplasmic protein [Arenibaculum pallidiluteum]|uniref:substrate-binding periplasmic protein n=1 Tax=Arenibaculum pallidiluteum TaxID=2812559 RepID=UPI001A96905A|nr:transporter substrate-binding domain-containing protein [Arenibaculum pallidiluteum]
MKHLFPIRRIGRLAAAAALLLGMASAGASATELWTVASDQNFPPYNFTLKGKRTGVDTQIIEAVLKRIGVSPIHRPMSWSEVVEAVDTNQVDLAFQFIASPERMERYRMVGPFRTGETVLLTTSNRNFDIKDIADLRGYRVGTIRGFTYAPSFDNDAEIAKLAGANATTNIRRLINGRVDILIGDRQSLLYSADEDGKLERVKIVGMKVGDFPRYVAFPKQRAAKAERFEKAMNELIADGTVDRIIRSWLSE